MHKSDSIKLGIKSYFRSFGFVLRHRLSHFFIYPIVLAVLMVTLFTIGLFEAVAALSEPIFDLFNIEPQNKLDQFNWDTVLYWLANLTEYLLIVLTYITLIYLYFKFQKYIVLILMAPLMSILSERVEEILTGRKFPFSFRQLLKDVLRGVLISVRNFAVEVSIVVTVWLVSGMISLLFSPLSIIVSPLAFIFLLFVSAYFYGFSSIDFNSERHRLSVSDSIRFVRNHKRISISNGIFFHLWMLVPVIGVMIAPVTCTVGAALALHESGNLPSPGTGRES